MNLPVTRADPESLSLLVVEDDDDYAALLEKVFADNPDYATTTTRATSLADALGHLRAERHHAVLVDLGLPDSDGLRTARQVLDVVDPPTAVVVFTAMRDQSMAAQALEIGAQDYVVKEDMTPQLVTRVVMYGVTRARLVDDLERARRGEERERELRRMERLAADGGTTSVSAEMLGARSVADHMGERYDDELVGEYGRIIRKSMDEQAFRGDETVAEDLRSLAAVLGYLGAGPRDVIELHTRCLREVVRAAPPSLASAAVEEGRVLVLQLMGRLAAYYRDRSIGSGSGERANDARRARSAADKDSS